nr:hypothetical protein GCM10025730_02790 [Promicromonospora thailandica]
MVAAAAHPLRGGPPPERDVLRGAPWWGVAAVLAGAVLVGWWLPLVGWTLAGFVVLDVLLGLRRSGTTSGVTPPGAP